MQKYAAYIKILDALLESIAWGRRMPDVAVMHLHLNGGAATELRNMVPREQLRSSGAFFTDESLGRRMVELVDLSKNAATPAWDPNCGAGDLLLRWSERLDIVGDDLEATLRFWGEQLHGVDIHPVFLQVAKRRLALAAISRGALLKRGKLKGIDQFFSGLECRNLFAREIKIPVSAVILMNPPFTMIETPTHCSDWSSGKVAFAAVAFLDCLKAAEPGQLILAILPDVLRSGSRYERWRSLISQHVSEAKVHVIGRFNDHADIDVFILQIKAGHDASTQIPWFHITSSAGENSIGNLCDVRIGTVVPHRHKDRGPTVSYLTTSTASPWQEINKVDQLLKHDGTCVKGPFLVVRRTSGPKDASRAVATIVNTTTPVAIENHLISLRPFDGSLATCRQILLYLQSAQVRRWLDQRIRCRHLTVSALKQIPIFNKREELN